MASLPLIRACFRYLRHRVNQVDSWRDMIWCLRGIGYERDIAHEFARLDQNYDEEGVNIVWENYRQQRGRKWSWVVVFQWLREDLDPETYKKFCEIYLADAPGAELALEGDIGLANLFVREIKGSLFFTDSKGNGFLYNKETRLWNKLYPNYICRQVSDVLKDALTKIKRQAEDIDYYRGTETAELYKPALAKVRSVNGATRIGKHVIQPLADTSIALNASKDLLPIKNGKVINLATLEVRDRVLEDYFTFECPVEYIQKDSYPIAEEFLREMCCGDREYIDYLRKLLAYFLSGEIFDRRFYILYGDGLNGKSTLINVMSEILSSYFRPMTNILTAANGKRRYNPELVSLMSARLGTVMETLEEDTLDSKQIKIVTSGDTIVCRPFYKEELHFVSNAKLCLMTNLPPKFDSSDKALAERVVVLPFKANFKNDSRYKDRLIDNIDEIFSYIIQGGTGFWVDKKPFVLPKTVKLETSKYFQDNNPLSMFLEHCCDLSKKKSRERASVIYDRYKQWSENGHMEYLSQKKFYNLLAEVCSKRRLNVGIVFRGIRLLDENAPSDEE